MNGWSAERQNSALHPFIRLIRGWLLFDLSCVIGVNSLLLWFFHNRFWYAPDEGNYAHVAQRILNGEVLNLQIQDVHPGYINFLNAAAFRIFGLDLLSLRYPLVFVAFVQSILIFVLFYRSGRPRLAAVAAISMNALGLVHFLNPTSNWYCLFLVVLIVCALHWLPRESKWRLVVVGFLVGIVVLFRQLSGLLVCIGVLTYLLLETESDVQDSRVLARSLIAIMAIGLAGYLFRTTDGIGLILFGLCPLLILIWLFTKTTVGNRRVLHILIHMMIGSIAAAVPLLLYHLLHGSLRAWVNDSIFSALGLTKLRFIDQRLYGRLVSTGFLQLFHFSSVGELLNALYWMILPLLAFVNGILLLRFLTRNSGTTPITLALPVLAVFYAIVSVHFQIAVYLYYSAGLSLVALLWMVAGRRMQYAVLSIALLLAAIGVYYHAGQPLSGGFADVFGGNRNINSLSNEVSSLPRASLKIDAEDAQRYSQILKLIESETRPDETIFALPSNAEFYFLSGRRNPFRFYNSALGIRTPADLQFVKNAIISQPPKLVLYRADDKYNTTYSREIVELVKERYDLLGDIDGFTIYRARQTSAI